MGPEEQIVEILRSKGYKATPQRISVARCVLTNKHHPSAESIYDEVKRVHPTISLSTVYNTLNVLKELNLVQETGLNENGVRFDSNTETHINLVCYKCGEIFDVDEPLLEEDLKRVERRTGFKRMGQRIDVYGFCRRCARNMEK